MSYTRSGNAYHLGSQADKTKIKIEEMANWVVQETTTDSRPGKNRFTITVSKNSYAKTQYKSGGGSSFAFDGQIA